MVQLIEREFTVSVPLQAAWDHLAHIEQWPSWAPHIRRIALAPPGELGPQSTGVIHLTNGIKPVFQVTEFNPPRNWKWVGQFLWLTVIYDHQFEAIDSKHTRLAWTVSAQGLAAGTIGRLFAMIYRRSLEKAIPRLIRQMNANPADV
jgi:carbon monoxide dehydrogenase subunit G